MNKIVASFVLLALLVSANAQNTLERDVLNTMMSKILLEEYNNVPTEDGYKFSYKTSDGSVREEVGIIMNPGTEQQEMVVMGSYGYEDSEGTRTVTMYTADKNGYKPRVQVKNRKLNPKLLASLAGK
ncbi:endocuticle structural glycoprotein SgAbd-9-like [Condylostylus longicornis]|uniref:endocuticle structural glycoprotein SgAbd-9-like n=1 Tax=Condylostylus longicornis TaxID=2530218 RepID=UPI00244E36A5|nr:endocuticle structural glycoprotein SgAbd-9-like [Condylostylus longicornis]